MKQTNGDSTRQYANDDREHHKTMIVFHRDTCEDLKHYGPVIGIVRPCLTRAHVLWG
jgi:hypothetical protein